MYCTAQQYIDAHGEQELIQLTDRNGIGVVDDAVLFTVMTKADAVINQRLRAKGWTIPLPSDLLNSEDLASLAMDIARFYLHGHLSEMPKPIQTDFELALKTLADYVKGVVTLDIGVPQSEPNTGSGAGDVDFSAPARVFNDDSLRGF
jgi:phage gp36-like protein